MWKPNWQQTQQRFVNWWNHQGLLIGMWGAPMAGGAIHETVPEPTPPGSPEDWWCTPEFRAAHNHFHLSQSIFPADVLPMANTDLGPGSLALFCGAKPGFSQETVWYQPCIEDVEEPEQLPPLSFDPENSWWQLSEEILRKCVERSQGQYLVGCPDLIENVDALASLRGAETLCMDMIERPEWVEQKVAELNEVWFAAYQRIYDLIKLDDGSSAFGAFYLWGPGRMAKLQCDASAMFSPQMYRQFVVPGLRAQCEWLDHSLYHLDGTQAMAHLDALLEIDALDAIEWTPQAGIETGGHPRWYDLYRRILSAGKSVQAVNIEQEEIIPLLEAIGSKGVYILTTFEDEHDAEQLLKRVESYH